MTRALALPLLLACALTAPTLAGEAEERARGAALLKRLAAQHPKLAGTRRFTTFNEDRRLGGAVYRLVATETGYRLELDLELAMSAAFKVQASARADLGPDLSLRSLEQTSRQTLPGHEQDQVVVRRVRREGDRLILSEGPPGEGVEVQSAPVAGPVLPLEICWPWLTPHLDRESSGALRVLQLPLRATPGVRAAEASLALEPTGTWTIRGQATKARRLVVRRGEITARSILVDATGTPLLTWEGAAEAPGDLQIVAATPEQFEADQAPPKLSEDQRAVRAVFLQMLDLMGGKGGAEVADAICDWKAIHANARFKPQDSTPESFRASRLKAFQKRPLPKDMRAMISASASFVVKGKRADVKAMGQVVLSLEQHDGAWKVVSVR